MWETPIYKFQIIKGGKKEDIFIDVTGSAPRFDVPGNQLECAFSTILHGLIPKNTKILDFGAAKLRNTLYLLKKGYQVYACEYEDLFKRSPQAQSFLKEAKTFPNFHPLIFPNDFINSKHQFDVVLLINVLNIMPIPIERQCVLSLCRERVRNNGRLLWYTQHGAYSPKDAVAPLYDGLVTGRGREYKMFYRDFNRKEIHEMLISAGFSYSPETKFKDVGNNQSYQFIADGPVLVDKSLGITQMLKNAGKESLSPIKRKVARSLKRGAEAKTYETKGPRKIISKADTIEIAQNWAQELKETKPGKKDYKRYQGIVFNLLKEIFTPQLKNGQMEEKTREGRGYIDIVFNNVATSGFFERLIRTYQIKCPFIMIECKNYNHDLANTEYNQIADRLSDKRGLFGIIICRSIKDKKREIKQCQDRVKDHGMYIVVLTDRDIIRMINNKQSNNISDIDDLLDAKLRPLLFDS